MYKFVRNQLVKVFFWAISERTERSELLAAEANIHEEVFTAPEQLRFEQPVGGETHGRQERRDEEISRGDLRGVGTEACGVIARPSLI